MRLPPWKAAARAWPQAASAGLLLLAFPPFHLGLVAFAALVPWLLSLRSDTGKGAWKSGYLFGFLLGLGQLHWIEALAERWTGSPVLGWTPWLLGCLAFALYFGLVGVLMRTCWARGAPWAIPLVWAGVEVFRSYIPVFAFPWALIGSPLWRYAPLIGSAHFGSIYVVSAWVAAANVLIALIMLGAPRRQIWALAGCFAAVLASSILYWTRPTPGQAVTVTAVQPGVDMAFGKPEQQEAELRASLDQLLSPGALGPSQLAVLPEGIARAPGSGPPQLPFDARPTCPFLIGGQRGESPTYQSAFAYDGSWKHADKTRLVIFGEFVPGRDWIPFLSSFDLPAGDLAAGTEGVTTLDVGPLRVGPVLCFEGLFPDISYQHALHGAKLLAVMSIDDWYMGTSAPDQLRAASVFRAVETGLPLVRAATLGYSMVVDPRGEVLAEAPLSSAADLTVPITLPASRPYFPAIFLFPALCLAAALVTTFLPVLSSPKTARTARSPKRSRAGSPPEGRL